MTAPQGLLDVNLKLLPLVIARRKKQQVFGKKRIAGKPGKRSDV